MAIQKIDRFWGDSLVNTFDLVIMPIENALYLPFSSTLFLDQDPNWGIYREDGSLVSEASYVRGPSQNLVGQSLFRDLSTIDFAESPHPEMIYAGPIIPHYGHFVITSLARLWAKSARVPFLFHSDPPIFDHGLPFLHEIFTAAGLNSSNSFSFSKPTRIKRLFVPQVSFIEQFYVSPSYSLSIENIRSQFAGEEDRDLGKYYISKSKLNRGVSRLIEEELIENRFAQDGFKIIYPETLSIRDQAKIFQNAAIVAGTASSAFHSAALSASSDCKRIVFSFNDFVNSNFSLMDSFLSGEARYYSLAEDVCQTGDDGFSMAWQPRDVEQLAEEMISVCK